MGGDRTITLTDGIVFQTETTGVAAPQSGPTIGRSTRIPLALSSADLQDLTAALASYLDRQNAETATL